MSFRTAHWIAALLLALAHEAGAAEHDRLARAHFLDIGHGDATLVEFPCGAMLIDTGHPESEADVLGYLRTFFESRPDLSHTLDLVVLTHIHNDHTGNFVAIAQEFGVLGVVHNGRYQGPQQAVLDWLDEHPQIAQFAARAEDIPPGGMTNSSVDPFACDSVDPLLTVLWGGLSERPEDWTPKHFRDRNNHSVTLRIDFGESSMLFTGDLERRGIRELLARQGAAVLDVDLFKIGHHGFPSGTTDALVEAVSPEIAVLSRPGNRRWLLDDYDIYTSVMERSRDPIEVPLYDEDPGMFPEQHERYDEDDNPTLSGTAGEFDTEMLDKSIYWTGLEGTIVVDASADGVLTVEE